MEKIQNKIFSSHQEFSPNRLIVFSFLFIILAGGFLLSLPISTKNGVHTSFLDSCFTATSAVCVTGLVLRDTGTYWNAFGKFIILLLIQIGGLGFLTFTTIGALAVGKKINLKTRLVMRELFAQNKLQGIILFTRSVFLFTLISELIGATLLSFVFVPKYGLARGIAFAIFHAISAFCNAGFDLNGDFNSLVSYSSNFLLNFTTMSLIIVGGLGFIVHFDILKNKKWSRLSLHTKIVLFCNTTLLIVGFILFFIFEKNNPFTLKNQSVYTQILCSAFQSVTCRTAGFNTMDLSCLNRNSKILSILLMFIGGSPASTAGGIKTTTIAVIFLITKTVVQDKRDIEAFHRKISFKSVNKAITILFIALTSILLACLIISTTEYQIPFLSILFEVVSAFGTVGLTLGVTTQLSAISKITLMFVMFLGRVGTLTILFTFTGTEGKKYTYAEEKIII